MLSNTARDFSKDHLNTDSKRNYLASYGLHSIRLQTEKYTPMTYYEILNLLSSQDHHTVFETMKISA